jgi:hypothetical protein
MIDYELKPFRDYCPEILGDPQSSTSISLTQLVRNTIVFLEKSFEKKTISKKQPAFE